MSYLATRKTVLPFENLVEMYYDTDFRLALVPSTTYEDNFKYSTDPLFQKIYTERLKPHLPDYKDAVDMMDMIDFIREDYATAVYDGFIPLT